MQIKQIIANFLISATLLSMIPSALAIDNNNINSLDNEYLVEIQDKIDITEVDVNDAISSVADINIQLDELYDKVSVALNIDTKYIKILHLLAGGQAVYADKKPNIYADETVTSMKGPFDIQGANTEYKQFSSVICADQNIQRPSKYYIPDAVYSVTYDIVQLMNQRYKYDRGGMQLYFDTLKASTKKNILFCEAVMLYTGEDEDTVNNFYKVYEKLIYDKQKDENILDICEDSSIKFKDKYLEDFVNNNISNEQTLKYLAITLSFDDKLAMNDNSESLRAEFVTPYIKNYTSRENLMLASMCLTGKVRYVWGGGHSGTSNIDGINPAWVLFEQIYDETPTIQNTDINTGENLETNSISFNHCIKPSGSWCPIHQTSEDSCSFLEPLVYSIDEYVDIMSNYIDTTEMDKAKYRELMKAVDFSEGIPLDTLNGLDCSGYISWLYNQITCRYEINSVAKEFTENEAFKEVEFGSELLPGDIFAWSSHIVQIIGCVNNNYNVYITTEATPNVIKFGVIYYTGAKEEEIELAKQIAIEANQLLGNINEYENPHIYCMNTAGLKQEYTDQNGNIISEEDYNTIVEDNTIDESNISLQSYNYCIIARFSDQFIDEDVVLELYGKKIKEMTAQEIIQYTIRKLPYSYISGYESYCGSIFDKSQVAIDL